MQPVASRTWHALRDSEKGHHYAGWPFSLHRGSRETERHPLGATPRGPACGHVVMRIVETPDVIYLDTRGAAYLRFERRRS